MRFGSKKLLALQPFQHDVPSSLRTTRSTKVTILHGSLSLPSSRVQIQNPKDGPAKPSSTDTIELVSAWNSSVRKSDTKNEKENV
jgi:hypothetical protein